MKANVFLELLISYLGDHLENKKDDEELGKAFGRLRNLLERFGDRKLPPDKIEAPFRNLSPSSEYSDTLMKPEDLVKTLKGQYCTLAQWHINQVNREPKGRKKDPHRIIMGILLTLFWVATAAIVCLTIVGDRDLWALIGGVVDLGFGVAFFTYEFISDKKNEQDHEISAAIFADMLATPGLHIDKSASARGRNSMAIHVEGDGNTICFPDPSDRKNEKKSSAPIIVAIIAVMLAMVLVFFGTGIISVRNDGVIVFGFGNKTTQVNDGGRQINAETYIEELPNHGTINFGDKS